MSVFAGLFKTEGAAKPSNSLFSNANKWKRDAGDAIPEVTPQLAAAGHADKAKRKRAADAPPVAADTKPSKVHKTLAPSKAAPAKDAPKSKTKQREAVAAAAATAKGTVRPAAKASAAPRQGPTTKSKADITKKAAADEAKATTKANKAKAASEPVAASDSDVEDDDEDDSKDEAARTEKLTRTVFVGNIPGTTKPKALKKLFAQFGAVDSVRLRSLPVKLDVKMPRRAAVASGNLDAARFSSHAYIVFQSTASVTPALALNMTEFEGLHLRVDRATASSLKKAADAREGGKEERGGGESVKYDPARSLFCGNLHLETQDEELIRFFLSGLDAQFQEPGGLPPVEAVRLIRDPDTSLGKGIGFVLFRTAAARRAALAMDGRLLRGRALRITSVKREGPAVGKKVAAWQGVAASKSGRIRGGPGGGGGKEARVEKTQGKRKASGKRPAVLARKQRELAKQKKK